MECAVATGMETRHVRDAVLKVPLVKTDRQDTCGIAISC